MKFKYWITVDNATVCEVCDIVTSFLLLLCILCFFFCVCQCTYYLLYVLKLRQNVLCVRMDDFKGDQ